MPRSPSCGSGTKHAASLCVIESSVEEALVLSPRLSSSVLLTPMMVTEQLGE